MHALAQFRIPATDGVKARVTSLEESSAGAAPSEFASLLERQRTDSLNAGSDGVQSGIRAETARATSPKRENDAAAEGSAFLAPQINGLQLSPHGAIAEPLAGSALVSERVGEGAGIAAENLPPDIAFDAKETILETLKPSAPSADPGKPVASDENLRFHANTASSSLAAAPEEDNVLLSLTADAGLSSSPSHDPKHQGTGPGRHNTEVTLFFSEAVKADHRGPANPELATGKPVTPDVIAAETAPGQFASTLETSGSPQADGSPLSLFPLSGADGRAIALSESGYGRKLAASAPDSFTVASYSKRPDGGLEIRLDPPDLGGVSIQFAQDDAGVQHATISTERSETLDLLRRHSELLQRELSRHGAGEFTLSFSDRHEGGQAAREPSEGRVFRLGETPELMVQRSENSTRSATLERIDIIA